MTIGPDFFDAEVLVARDPGSVRITSEPEIENDSEELDGTGSAVVDNPDVEVERLEKRNLGWGGVIGDDADGRLVGNANVEGEGEILEARELREGDEEVGPGQGEDIIESEEPEKDVLEEGDVDIEEEPEEDVLEERDVDVEEELEVGSRQSKDMIESEEPEEFDVEFGLEARDVSEENDESFEESESDSSEVDNPDAGVEVFGAEGKTGE